MRSKAYAAARWLYSACRIRDQDGGRADGCQVGVDGGGGDAGLLEVVGEDVRRAVAHNLAQGEQQHRQVVQLAGDEAHG